MCHNCGARVNSADYTLLECPAWGSARRDLLWILKIKEVDFSLENMVKGHALQGEEMESGALLLQKRHLAEEECEEGEGDSPGRSSLA